jgi:CDP-glucose 4,6-dehydratase
VLETASAYLCLAQRLSEAPGSYKGAWNFGPMIPEITTVGELASRFYRSLGQGEWKDASTLHESDPPEARVLKLCVDKARSDLEWQPVYGVDRAIERTASWYRDVMFGGVSALEACTKDIEDYTGAALKKDAWWCTE